MRFTYDINDIKNNEKVACLRVTTIDQTGEPSVMTIPIVLDKYKTIESFVATVNLIECEDDKPESLEDMCNFNTKDVDYKEILQDMDIDFTGAWDSYSDNIMMNIRNEINLIPVLEENKWRQTFYKQLERFAKGIEEFVDLDPLDYKFLDHNVNIILKSLLPELRNRYEKYIEESAYYNDTITLKIHLVCKEIMKVIEHAEVIYREMI